VKLARNAFGNVFRHAYLFMCILSPGFLLLMCKKAYEFKLCVKDDCIVHQKLQISTLLIFEFSLCGAE
jgi:hypothetical protein